MKIKKFEAFDSTNSEMNERIHSTEYISYREVVDLIDEIYDVFNLDTEDCFKLLESGFSANNNFNLDAQYLNNALTMAKAKKGIK